MKIVLDTNVIVAAFASRGLCKDVFECCLYEHKIVASKPLISEVSRISQTKIKLPLVKTQEICRFIELESRIVIPVVVSKKECRDAGDLKVLGTALSAEADSIVSGDKDLLVLKKFKNIPIMSPRQFWEFAKKG